MSQKLPNIILIVMDTMGAKHMSLYGYPRPTTPYLERIAEECTVYTRCFAPACWTIPSHASMFTGLYPSQHGAWEGKFILNNNIQHLVPTLKMMGYRTAGISCNHVVDLPSSLCPGFDYFFDFGSGFLKLFKKAPQNKDSLDDFSIALKNCDSIIEKSIISVKYGLENRHWRIVAEKIFNSIFSRFIYPLDKLFGLSPYTNSSTYSEKTLKYSFKLIKEIFQKNDQPFFLFLNFFEPHEYYRPPLRLRKFSKWHNKQWLKITDLYKEDNEENSTLNTYINLYDDEILYSDEITSRLWTFLKELKLLDNTAFIFTSDHGEHLGEKGLYGHMLSLYNEVLWVPLLIHFPHNLKEKGLREHLVSLNDLYSTILDLVDCPFPPFQFFHLFIREHPKELHISSDYIPGNVGPAIIRQKNKFPQKR